MQSIYVYLRSIIYIYFFWGGRGDKVANFIFSQISHRDPHRNQMDFPTQSIFHIHSETIFLYVCIQDLFLCVGR